MKAQPKYAFYATLLDCFQRYLDTTEDNFFYQDEAGAWHRNYDEQTGEYHFSPSEVDDMAKQELLDRINRVPYSSPAATKGTAFNAVVDCLIHKRRDPKVEMHGDRETDTIYAVYEGQAFYFSFSFVEEVAARFEGALSQFYTEAMLPTQYGVVKLYGFIDEMMGNRVYDIKTTGRGYTFGQYGKNWQRHVYPYCLTESGMCSGVQSFEFTCCALAGGTERSPRITGRVYPEVYTYTHAESRDRLTSFCERFIEFLEDNRALITDGRVFGLYKK